ncbi:MAG: DUF3618 domain-containing protein [Microbacteriaceae bacterium]|nr:DUF3618 domain-containing protein [Cryobacterium sp.]MCC6376148.1 DUF3618 domain-containing protein [Microbacteriaceae bacterium]
MTSESVRSAQARRELEQTLNAIEDKLNVPKRVGELRETVVESWRADPLLWLIGAVAGVIVVGGLIAWAFKKDD